MPQHGVMLVSSIVRRSCFSGEPKSLDASGGSVFLIMIRPPMIECSRAKPEGAQGCEIWMKVGDPARAVQTMCTISRSTRARRTPLSSKLLMPARLPITCCGGSAGAATPAHGALL